MAKSEKTEKIEVTLKRNWGTSKKGDKVFVNEKTKNALKAKELI